MSDESLRRAYQARRNSTDAGESPSAHRPAERAECPSPEAIAQLAQGAGAAAVGALEHVLQCPYCLPEFELLRTLARAERDARLTEGASAEQRSGRAAPPPEGMRAPADARRRRSTAGWAMAATMLVAVALGGTWWQRHTGARDSETGEAGTVQRGDVGDLVVVAPHGSTGGEPLVFTWRAVERGPLGGAEVRYVVEAFDSVGALVLSRAVRDTVLVPNEGEGAALRRARTFDWMVRAERGDGNERRSALVRVRLDAPNGSSRR